MRFLAAASGGVGGMIDDHLICTRPWGFAPEDVCGPVQLWHGAQDELVPIDQAMHLAAALPRVQAALHPDEGHFFYRRRLREILGDLVAAAGPATGPSSCRATHHETAGRASAPAVGAARARASPPP